VSVLHVVCMQLDVVGENYISPENVQRPLVYTEVERLAFSSTGDWMASVERRDDGDTAPESRLRLWAYDATSQRFVYSVVRYRSMLPLCVCVCVAEVYRLLFVTSNLTMGDYYV
jgi:hypothetical protein